MGIAHQWLPTMRHRWSPLLLPLARAARFSFCLFRALCLRCASPVDGLGVDCVCRRFASHHLRVHVCLCSD